MQPDFRNLNFGRETSEPMGKAEIRAERLEARGAAREPQGRSIPADALYGKPLATEVRRGVGSLEQGEAAMVVSIHEHATVGEGIGEFVLGELAPGSCKRLARGPVAHDEDVSSARSTRRKGLDRARLDGSVAAARNG